MNNLIRISCISILVSISFLLNAQKNVVVIDTIELNTNKVVLYSDNTWSYLMGSDTKLSRQDSLNIMNTSWDTQQIFGYLSERGKEVDAKFEKTSMEKEMLTVPVYGKIYGGFRRGHDGVDIALNRGDHILAALDGKVRYAQYHHNGYGNLVVIRHYNGLETWYSHLDKITVRPNQEVKSGDFIGTGGRTGRASANHLHFETRFHDKPLDPQMFFDFEKSGMLVKSSDTAAITLKEIKVNREISSSKKTESKGKSSKKIHTIKSGDTLSKIARDYHTTVEDICKVNRISKDGVLSLGQKVKIPN